MSKERKKQINKVKTYFYIYTVGSKIIGALELIRVKKLILNAVLMNKYLSIHDL